jgi:hypothetical protein
MNIDLTSMKNNKQLEVITGFKYAEIADIIFSGVFLKSKINDLNLKDNIDDHFIRGDNIFVRNRKFTISENDIIFCKTEYVNELFYLLKKQCNFKNLKLITHQSDKRITKRIYKKKPDCISKWYSINVDTYFPNLIPIPLGIADFHEKNLNKDSFTRQNLLENFLLNKKNLLYLNFNQNTNFSHRKNIYSTFKKKTWANINKDPLSNKVYQAKITEHSFNLAPWGNGIDTHRFWESLYSNSIPVTKDHLLYNSFQSLPMLLVESYEQITKKFLNNFLTEVYETKDIYNLEKLDFKYWRQLICDNSGNIPNERKLELINHRHEYFFFIANLKHTIFSKLKVFNRLRRLIHKYTKI